MKTDEMNQNSMENTENPNLTPNSQTLAQRLTNNALYLVAAYAIYFASTIILVRESIRFLGADLYGVWVFASSLLAIFLLFNLGIDMAIKKFLAEYKRKDKPNEIAAMVGTATILFILFAVPSLISFYAILFFFVPLNIVVTNIIIFQFLLLMFFSFIVDFFSRLTGAIIEGLQNFKVVGITKISASLVTLVVTLLFLLIGMNLLSLPLAYLIGGLVGLGINLVFILNKRLKVQFRINRVWFAFLLQFGLSILVIRISSQVNLEWGKIITASFFTLDAVTSYDVANRLNWMIWVIPTIALPALLPASSELSIENKPIISRIFLVGTKLILIPSIFLFVFAFFTADQILSLWIGPAYAYPSAYIFQILAIAFSTSITIQVGVTLLLGINKRRTITIWSLINIISAIILSLVLIVVLGFHGLLIAIVGSWTVSNFAIGIYCCMEFGIPKSHFLRFCVFRQLIASLIAMLPTLVIRVLFGPELTNLVLGFFISLAIYLGLIFLMKVVGRKELNLIRGFFIQLGWRG